MLVGDTMHLQPELVDRADGPERDRVVLVVRLRPALGEPAPIGQLALGRLAIEAIISTASTGCFPTAVSWESITASVPSKIALATSATSARVGRVEWTIDSSIWVAVMVGLAARPATASSRFWTSGTSSIGSSMPRSPRAIMIPSAAWMISSPLAAAWGFSIFAISGTSTPRAARCSRTGSRSSLAPHEREREEVHAHLEPGVDQVDVLLAHGGERDRDVGQVQALPRRDATPHLDRRDHVAVVHRADPEPDGSVGQVEHVALVHQLGEPLPRHRQAVGCALHLLAREHDPRLPCQLRHAAGHGPDPELGPGQVTEDGHVPAGALGALPDGRGYLGVLLGCAVREVEPGDVHAGGDHLLEDVRALRGGADRRDDLRRAHALWTLPTKSPLLATDLRKSMLTLGVGEVLMATGLTSNWKPRDWPTRLPVLTKSLGGSGVSAQVVRDRT